MSENRRLKDLRRLKVMLRDRLICRICNSPVKMNEASIDHIISRGNGGTDRYENLQLTHRACNNFKNQYLDQPSMNAAICALRKDHPSGGDE